MPVRTSRARTQHEARQGPGPQRRRLCLNEEVNHRWKRPVPSSPWWKSGVAPRRTRRLADKARRLRILSIFEGGATQDARMYRSSNAGGLSPRAARVTTILRSALRALQLWRGHKLVARQLSKIPGARFEWHKRSPAHHNLPRKRSGGQLRHGIGGIGDVQDAPPTIAGSEANARPVL